MSDHLKRTETLRMARILKSWVAHRRTGSAAPPPVHAMELAAERMIALADENARLWAWLKETTE